MSILLYGRITWTLSKRLAKKLDANYERILRAILNKSRKQHPSKQQRYGHQPHITKTSQIRRTRHARYCWRSKDELIKIFPWNPSYGRAGVGQPARTYLQQLCTHTGCSLEALPEAMDDWDEWRESERERMRERERERESGKSVKEARHDNDDIYIYIYIYIYVVVFR